MNRVNITESFEKSCGKKGTVEKLHLGINESYEKSHGKK